MKMIKSVRTLAFAQIDMKYATITVGSTEIKVGEGNLTFSEKRNIEYKLEKGLLDDVREGDQVPMDVKFDVKWEYVIGDVEQAIKNPTTSSDSGSGASCRPKAVDVTITFAPPCSGDGSGSGNQIVLPDFRWEAFDWDLKAGTISVSGKCNAVEAIKSV